MQSDLDQTPEYLDFYENHHQDLEQNSDFTTTQAVELLNQALAQLTNLSTVLAQQTQENTQFIQELGQGVLSQATIITDLHQQTHRLKETLEQITLQVKDTSAKTTTLAESLNEIQESQKLILKNRRQLTTQTTRPSSGSLGWNKLVPGLIAQALLAATITIFLVHQFPPKATPKAEQQWYSIFQRVDRLYKARFGNTAPK